MPVPCDEYAPSEDTFLLCDYIQDISGEHALDIGGGSGYVTKLLERHFSLVICTDISHGVLAHQTYPASNRICCNAADAVGGLFDLIVSNPPYLDTDLVRFADTDGGPGGVQVPGMFLASAAPLLKSGGQIAMVASSLSRLDLLEQMAAGAGLRGDIVLRRKLFFEELYVVRYR